jgi:hypothetical protein
VGHKSKITTLHPPKPALEESRSVPALEDANTGPTEAENIMDEAATSDVNASSGGEEDDIVGSNPT